MSKEYSEFCTLPCKVLMNKAPPIAKASERLVDLTHRLLDVEYKLVVVYDGSEPVGIVTLKDIMKWLVRVDNKEEVILRDLVSVPLIMVDLEAPLQDALELMEKYDIRHIGVHEHKVLKGLLSQDGVKSMCELYPHYLRQYIVK